MSAVLADLQLTAGTFLRHTSKTPIQSWIDPGMSRDFASVEKMSAFRAQEAACNIEHCDVRISMVRNVCLTDPALPLDACYQVAYRDANGVHARFHGSLQGAQRVLLRKGITVLATELVTPLDERFALSQSPNQSPN